MIATRVRQALFLIPLLMLPGCRESGMDLSAPDKSQEPVFGQATACLFGLCNEPIPADSAGMAALASSVKDSAYALGLAFLADSRAFAPKPDTFQWIQTDKLGFTLRIGQQGLFPRLDVTVRISGTGGDLAILSTARVGQRKSLAGFPAVGSMDSYYTGLILSGSTNIYGPALFWRGDMAASYDYETRYTGSTPKPTVWKSENPIWKNLPLTFPGAIEWMTAHDSLLDAPDPGGIGYQDSWYTTRIVPGGTRLKDTTLTDARLISKGSIVIGAGSVLRNCIVIAGDAAIEGDARIENSLVYGRDRLLVTGSPILTGQFLSRDSLYLETQAAFTGYPIFYVHGNPRKAGGQLMAAKATGEAMLLYGGARNAQNDNAVHLVTRDSVDIKGLVYANGSATIGGTTHGSVLFARHVWIGRTGTTYLGFLMNAQYYPPDASALLPMPLLLNPAEAALLSVSTNLSFKAR